MARAVPESEEYRGAMRLVQAFNRTHWVGCEVEYVTPAEVSVVTTTRSLAQMSRANDARIFLRGYQEAVPLGRIKWAECVAGERPVTVEEAAP